MGPPKVRPLKSLSTPEWERLRRELLSYPRRHGYYLLELVEVSGPLGEAELDLLLQHFDDHAWPPAEQRPTDELWDPDYLLEPEQARLAALAAMVGGPDIGHLQHTIPPERAEQLWRDFDQLFEEPKRYFGHLGLGNPDYVFQHGIVIVDQARAGILWVVESD